MQLMVLNYQEDKYIKSKFISMKIYVRNMNITSMYVYRNVVKLSPPPYWD